MADRLNGALAGVPCVLGKLVEWIGGIKPKLAALAERHLLRFCVAHPEQLALEILACLNGFGIASVEGHRPLGVLPRCWVDANAYLDLPFAAFALRLVLHRIYAAYALRSHGSRLSAHDAVLCSLAYRLPAFIAVYLPVLERVYRVSVSVGIELEHVPITLAPKHVLPVFEASVLRVPRC